MDRVTVPAPADRDIERDPDWGTDAADWEPQFGLDPLQAAELAAIARGESGGDIVRVPDDLWPDDPEQDQGDE